MIYRDVVRGGFAVCGLRHHHRRCSVIGTNQEGDYDQVYHNPASKTMSIRVLSQISVRLPQWLLELEVTCWPSLQSLKPTIRNQMAQRRVAMSVSVGRAGTSHRTMSVAQRVGRPLLQRQYLLAAVIHGYGTILRYGDSQARPFGAHFSGAAVSRSFAQPNLSLGVGRRSQ